MIQKEYEKLAECLEEMIADGCRLVHGGNLIDWKDTKIFKILKKIETIRKSKTFKEEL